MANSVGLDCCPVLVNGRVPMPGSALGFQDYNFAQSDSVFVTTSMSFVSTGKQLVTPVLSAGIYRLGHWCQIGENNVGTFSDPRYNVDLDGGGFVWPNSGRMFSDSTGDFFGWYRSRIINLTAGAHTFDVRMRSGNGNQSRMEVSLLELWREPPSVSGESVDPCLSSTQDLITSFSASGRVVTGRTLVTPVVPAGTYRIRCDYIFERDSGSASRWNIALDGVDQLSSYVRESIFTNRFSARTIVLHVALSAGSHTFALVANTTSTTSYTLGQSAFYCHKVP